MIFYIAVVLLAVWALGLIGVYNGGQALNIFPVVGVLLLVFAFLKARD